MKNFSESEIEKLKELKRLKLYQRISLRPQVGSWIFSSEALENSFQVEDGFFILQSSIEIPERAIWLLTLDEVLRIGLELKISFAQITDFIHRRRFADGKEREGTYQLLIEVLRSSSSQSQKT